MMPSSKSKTKQKSSPVEPVTQWSFAAIGTRWWIGIYDSSVMDVSVLQQAVNELIDEFDKTYSRFRADSLVTRMSKQAGTYVLPNNAAPLLNSYRTLYEATDGAVTPLVGQLLSDAGYDASYTLQPKQQPVAALAWDEVLLFEANKLTLKQSALLDFGAAGKGYLVDLVTRVLRDAGVGQFCVDAGGDMYVHGLAESLRIGLEHPHKPDEVIGVVYLADQALCGSAPNRRAWGAYHHIMNPKTAASTTNMAAVWVTANSALAADGLATALFFTEPQVLLQHFEFEYALVYADGSLRTSPNFKADFFDATTA